MEEFKFEVGAHYENIKGLYEVIEVDGEALRIKWVESGEVVATTVSMQRRILEHIARLHRDRTSKSGAKRSGSFAGYGKAFHGLVDADFQTGVTGTTWRGRQNLGGAVTTQLRSERDVFIDHHSSW